MNGTSPPESSSTKYNADEIVANRNGEVLIPHSLLKSDHFPGCQNTKLRPLVEGAPNFRGIEGLPVFGVAIPTVVGLRNVLALLGAQKGRRKVTWINLREEPVIYVNGSPYVVRESDKPFANLEYTGIDTQRVEEMEKRLKADVLAEASQYDGSVMVAEEDDQFQIVVDWEPVTDVDIQTPAEVYEELCNDGYNLDYLRVPVTDEKAPGGDDFEILMRKSWEIEDGDAIVFNSQGYLAPPPVLPQSPLPAWWCHPEELDIASPKAGADDLKNGMFLAVRSMLRALENGRSAKVALDLVLDACAAMQNLREAIAAYRSRIFHEQNEMRRHICIWITHHVPFSTWVTDRPELLAILEKLLRANPLSALNFDEKGKDNEALVEREESFAEHIAHRPGSVLGPHTILKLDHFKGCQSSRLKYEIGGAPNFRGLRSPGIHVYGGAIATVDGIKRVLDSLVQAQETVPIITQEASRPFKNLMEYRGIDAQRLDQMEQRLREDVIHEASEYDGEMIVTVEEILADGNRILKDKIVKIVDSKLVETPRQVLEKLQAENYRVNFIRIPLTDGTCPKPKDFDLFYGAAAAARPNDALIYTCQLGGGRTTTGMCIGALLRMHLNGAAVPNASALEKLDTVERLDEDIGGNSPRRNSSDEGDAYELQGPYVETPRTSLLMSGTPSVDPEREIWKMVNILALGGSLALLKEGWRQKQKLMKSLMLVVF
eukprot:jgi/Picre1/27882/NNA_000845.t1